jgi:hypothetical protein
MEMESDLVLNQINLIYFFVKISELKILEIQRIDLKTRPKVESIF